MAVLCEALSVVIRTGSVKEKFDGGFSEFLDKIPNDTYCSDGELERIGFLSPAEIGKFIAVLETSGLTFQANNESVDICVVDMLTGPTTKCHWIEFHKISFGEGKVSIAWLFEGTRVMEGGLHFKTDKSLNLNTPQGWEYDKSLSKEHKFMSTDNQY
tara:strand:- start:83 stop:553 length:471 start_codon:yes stop_codon:yes gene_type:complete